MTFGAKPVPPPTDQRPLELWGGIECTVNRIGDRYVDQLELSRHAERVDDLDRIAALGIKVLRYPVIWERVAANGLDHADWDSTDRALTRLRELGIEPIVGLVHHGSGPRHTNLLDPGFAAGLADFARAVAERYPWVRMFTPINEPLTTARFATLYGHWYPHARDDRSFVRAVMNQCAGIRGAMAAIRAIVPDAQLVQTEDLGKTYSTPPLRYQAIFDNNRRWLTFDILTGRFDDSHPLWWYTLESGAGRAELQSFLDQPCVPNILGLNYYLTSERFLDHRLDLYSSRQIGSNGRQPYADVEAVRVLEDGLAGHETLVGDAWDRYGLPIAITEVQLGCTREQQMRWLSEAWKTSVLLRSRGVDVRAVTAWSVLGAFGWSSLLTDNFDQYETGVFDVRAEPPRPTALAGMIRSLAVTGTCDHAALDGEGWWRKDARLTYPPYIVSRRQPAALSNARHQRPILITGSRGTLGYAFSRIAAERDLAAIPLERRELDITKPEEVRARLRSIKPWAVVNAAGYVRVDDAETEPAACRSINTDGAVILAEECARLGIPVVSFSSDLVFDGAEQRRYVETDRVNPLCVYGASKAAAEAALGKLDNTMIVRTSAFFGPWDSSNFLAQMRHALHRGAEFSAASDTRVSPTYVPDLVNVCLDLLIDGERGIWHLANDGELSWSEFAASVARACGLNVDLVRPAPASDLEPRARRPVYTALGTNRARLMPSLDDAIARYVAKSGEMSTAPAPRLETVDV